MKMYTVKEYLNSNKDPFGLTIKGKSKNFKEAQKTFQATIINGKTISTSEGKFKVSDFSHNRGIKNAILQFSKGVYDTNMDKKKGAAIEIRKTSGSEYEYVEKLKEAVTCILDKYLVTWLSEGIFIIFLKQGSCLGCKEPESKSTALYL